VTRARVFFWLRLAFGVTVLLLLVFGVADFDAVAQTLRTLHPATFLIALAGNAVATVVVPALVTSHTLRAGSLRIPIGELMRINLALRFYVLVLPHAVTWGIRWLRYRGERPGHGWQAAALIVFERVIQFAVLVFFAFFFLLWAGSGVPTSLRVLVPVSAVCCLVGLLSALMFVSPRLHCMAIPIIRAVARRSPRFLAQRIDRMLEAVAAHQQLSHRRVAAVVGWTVVAHLLSVTMAYLISLELRLPADYAAIAWMRSAVVVVSMLPVTVGGIGIREAGFAGLLYIHGADASDALALPLSLLAIQLLIGLTGAAVELLHVLTRDRSAAA